LKGQSLVETVLLIPLVLLLLSSVFWFARVLLTRQLLATAARYGTDMILYSKLNENQIRQELRNYLCDSGIEGRTLDGRALPDENIKVKIAGYESSAGGRESVFSAAESLMFPERRISTVEISYEFETPRIFLVGEKVMVTGSSAVLAGTGCGSRIHKRNKGR
jgi:hypothetical protein